MKQFFEEPKLCLEQFTVADQTMTSSDPLAWVGYDPTNPGNETLPITPRNS